MTALAVTRWPRDHCGVGGYVERVLWCAGFGDRETHYIALSVWRQVSDEFGDLVVAGQDAAVVAPAGEHSAAGGQDCGNGGVVVGADGIRDFFEGGWVG